MAKNALKREALCQCGQVAYSLERVPIMTVACYCNSCREVAVRFQQLESVPEVAENDGSTHYIMQRKDRLHCERGQEYLREFRLAPKSTSRRVIASCCNSPMFLEMKNGHWLSVYKQRIDKDSQPPIDMRTMTGDREDGIGFLDDIPSPKKHTIGFMWKLMKAWVAMGFKAPKIDYVKGTFDG